MTQQAKPNTGSNSQSSGEEGKNVFPTIGQTQPWIYLPPLSELGQAPFGMSATSDVYPPPLWEHNRNTGSVLLDEESEVLHSPLPEAELNAEPMVKVARKGITEGRNEQPPPKSNTVVQKGLPDKEATSLLTSKSHKEISVGSPKEALNSHQQKGLVNRTLQSAIKGINNFLSWRPFETKPPATRTHSISLASVNNNLTASMQTVNSLLEEAARQPDKARQNYLEAAKLSSTTLQQTLANENFRKGIRHLAKLRREHEAEMVDTMTNLLSLEKFIEKEYKLLIAYNVPMADTLIQEGRKVIADIYAGKIPPQTIYVAIDNLRKATSTLYSELDKQYSEQNRERTVKILKKAALGIGASAVAIVNVQAEATLTAPLAVLSGNMAAGIIGAAATDVWNLVTGSAP